MIDLLQSVGLVFVSFAVTAVALRLNRLDTRGEPGPQGPPGAAGIQGPVGLRGPRGWSAGENGPSE